MQCPSSLLTLASQVRMRVVVQLQREPILYGHSPWSSWQEVQGVTAPSSSPSVLPPATDPVGEDDEEEEFGGLLLVIVVVPIVVIILVVVVMVIIVLCCWYKRRWARFL